MNICTLLLQAANAAGREEGLGGMPRLQQLVALADQHTSHTGSIKQAFAEGMLVCSGLDPVADKAGVNSTWTNMKLDPAAACHGLLYHVWPAVDGRDIKRLALVLDILIGCCQGHCKVELQLGGHRHNSYMAASAHSVHLRPWLVFVPSILKKHLNETIYMQALSRRRYRGVKMTVGCGIFELQDDHLHWKCLKSTAAKSCFPSIAGQLPHFQLWMRFLLNQ